MRIDRLASSCLLVSLFPCLLVFSAGCTGKSAPDPVYIGHVAANARALREAILLAVEEANAAEGQVAGRPMAVLHPEVGADAESAQAVAVRLLTIDRVPALLTGLGPNATERLARAAQQYSVPLVATMTPPRGTLPPFGFSVGLSPTARGKALARFLAEHLSKPNVAIVADDGAIHQETAANFAEPYRAAGGKIEKQWNYGKDKELVELPARLEKSQAAAIVFAGSAADFARFQAKQRRESTPLLFAGEETAPDVLVPDSRPAKAPVYRATAFVIDPSVPPAKDFADKFLGRFKQPPDAADALAYDSARVLFDAMRRAGGFHGPKVREELLNTKDFESTTGPLAFDKNQNARRAVFVVRVENGKETLAKRYDPEAAAAKMLPTPSRRGSLAYGKSPRATSPNRLPPVSRTHPCP